MLPKKYLVRGGYMKIGAVLKPMYQMSSPVWAPSCRMLGRKDSEVPVGCLVGWGSIGYRKNISRMPDR